MSQSLAEMSVNYLDYDDKSLFLEIGQRASLSAEKPAAATAPPAELKVEFAHLGVNEDLVELGKRIAKRLLRELNKLLCGDDAADKEEREKVAKTFGLTNETVAAAIAAALVSSFGIGAAIAALVAAIFVKRILAPTIEETCAVWTEALSRA